LNILDIGITNQATGFANVAPFVYATMPGGFQLADYWVTIFGAADESNTKIIRVTSFTRASVNNYTSVSSLASCLTFEKSFYFDFTNQILYVHFEHDQNPLTDNYQYTVISGFNDSKGLIYIDNIEYLPLIKSIPSIAQQASIIGYDQQAYVDGSVVLENAKGIMDFLIIEKVYGNDASLFYLDDDDIVTDGKIKSASSTIDIQIQKSLTAPETIQTVLENTNAYQAVLEDPNVLIPLASFYIEKRDFTLQDVTISVQDKRKAENPTIPSDTYLSSVYPDMHDSFVGKPIPVHYGAIRELHCTPLNSEAVGDVDFKAGELLTSFGTIQVSIDDIWTNTTTHTSLDLPTATFTLATAEARDTSGAVRKCKLVSPIGEVVTYASDVIKALNLKYLGIPFVSSFYDLTEWGIEEAKLETIGISIDKERPLSDWIKDIQGGANIGFRYEITPDGHRTIRARENTRASSAFIPIVSIFNNDTLPIEDDPESVFGEVKVKYSKSYESGRTLSVLDDTYRADVIANYKQYNRLTVDTFLTSSAHAAARALNDSLDFSVMRPNATIIAVGSDMLSFKIYEVITVELEKTDRTYFGTVDALILGIDPDGFTKTNVLKVRIL
jgi:hypothetical protein